MTAFNITGNFDEVRAKLKATLDANDARFNANLKALFKPPPSRKPAAPAAESHTSTGWALSTKHASNRDAAGSLNGRLRTSPRVTPSR